MKEKKGNSKNFQKLVRQRMQKKGETHSVAPGVVRRRIDNSEVESYSVARDRLVRKRIEIAEVGHVIVGNGRLIPHTEIRYRPGADSTQFFKAMFGPDWRPPSERCPECHEWITFDGVCLCNAHEQPTELTHTVTMTPFDSPPEGGDDDDDPVRAKLKEWINLPEVPATADGEWFLAAELNVLVVSADAADETGLYALEPFGPEYIVLSSIKLQVQGDEWAFFRLPHDLGMWALAQEKKEQAGQKQFPALFRLMITDEGCDVRLSSMRAQ